MRPIDPADTKLRVRAFLRLFSIPVCAYDRIALSLSLSLLSRYIFLRTTRLRALAADHRRESMNRDRVT